MFETKSLNYNRSSKLGIRDSKINLDDIDTKSSHHSEYEQEQFEDVERGNQDIHDTEDSLSRNHSN
jgi:hypothetical protein